MSPSGASSLLKNVALASTATLVALGLGEAAVRVAIMVWHREPIVASDPGTGWRGRADLDDVDVAMSGGHFRVTTDGAGRRVLPPGPTEIGVSTVVLVGDSFSFGLAVNDRETFPWFLAEQHGDRRFLNLGVPGWGPDQEMVSLEQYFREAGTTVVSDVIVLVTENDFSDVQRSMDTYLGRRKPTFRMRGTELDTGAFRLSVADHLMDVSRLTWLVRSKLASIRRLARIDPAGGEEIVVAALERIRLMTEARGARLHLFAYRRSREKTGLTDAMWRSFLDRSHATDITASIFVGDGDPIAFDGGHWSAEGNRRAARVMGAGL